MRVTVDLNRCQGYGQCVFAAPDVFAMDGQEALYVDYEPSDDQRERVLLAASACPKAAVILEPSTEGLPGYEADAFERTRA